MFKMVHCLASHCIRNLHVMVLKTKMKGQTKYVVCIKGKKKKYRTVIQKPLKIVCYHLTENNTIIIMD
jgi:hypothetical protein